MQMTNTDKERLRAMLEYLRSRLDRIHDMQAHYQRQASETLIAIQNVRQDLGE